MFWGRDFCFFRNEILIKPLTQIESRRGLENAIISNGKIVNVVSNSYGHISNQLFFKKAEQMLLDAGLNYHKRSVNRKDRSYIIDFIIEDSNQFKLKNNEFYTIVKKFEKMKDFKIINKNEYVKAVLDKM